MVKWETLNLTDTAPGGGGDLTLTIEPTVAPTGQYVVIVHALSIKSQSANNDVRIRINDGTSSVQFLTEASTTSWANVEGFNYPLPLPKGWSIELLFKNVPAAEVVNCAALIETRLAHNQRR